jgi:hypothetical protein
MLHRLSLRNKTRLPEIKQHHLQLFAFKQIPQISLPNTRPVTSRIVNRVGCTDLIEDGIIPYPSDNASHFVTSHQHSASTPPFVGGGLRLSPQPGEQTLRALQVAARTPLWPNPTQQNNLNLHQKAGLGAGSLGLARAFFAPSLSSISRRLRSYFSASAAVSFSSRLGLLFFAADLSLTASICCIWRRSILPSSRHLSAANRGQRPQSNALGEGSRLSQGLLVELRKRYNSKTLVTLTCFSCCATEAATSFVAATEAISPPAQKLDHGSCEDPTPPLATVATAAGPADTATGTTANCPDSAPTPWSSQKTQTLPNKKSQKLTSRSQSRVGVEHCNPAHKVIVHGKLRGDFGARHRCLSSARWRGRPSLKFGRDRWWHAGTGAAGFVLGRAIFASRLGSANLANVRRFHSASWRSFSIIADTTAPTFRP